MTGHQGQRVSRSELYKLVWSEPQTKVAKRFGVSDSAIGKICKRHDIPRPGRGYWQRSLEEQKRLKKALEVPKAPRMNFIIIEPSPRHSDLHSTKTIIVPSRVRNYHPLVEASRATLASGSKSEYGFIRPKDPCLAIRVTKSSLPRALRIFDTLIKALEKYGYTVKVEGGSRAYTYALIEDQKISFGIEERQRTLLKQNQGRLQLQPTGKLSLVLYSAYQGFRGSWNDGKKQKVEILLGSFISEIKRLASDKAKREEEWKITQAVSRKVMRLQEIENKNLTLLNSLIRQEQFVNDAQSLLVKIESTPRLEATFPPAWLAWAKNYIACFRCPSIDATVRELHALHRTTWEPQSVKG